MLRGNIAVTSLKMLLKNLYSVKCYYKLNMNRLTLSLWENFWWGLIYFDQFISEYISTFDSMYRKIEKLDMKLPSHILAFKLLRKAKISKEENMLILTGMNYGNKGTLYDENKASLKKFKGDITGGNLSAGIKLEPTFLAENEEALLAAGYFKQNQAKKVTKWGKGGGYNRGGGRQTQGQDFRRKMNPVGSDGQTLICKACGSYRHLMAECPDSWENMRRVNVVEEENVVLFTR